MRKTISFGKVDYLNHGRRDCEATVDIELRTRDDGRPELSICGRIWNARHTDIYSGGQNLDTIAEYIKTPLFREIYRFWELYHLNGSHPECEHQAEQGWKKIAGEKVTIWEYTLTADTISAQNAVKNKVLTAAKTGETYSTRTAEQVLLSLDYALKSPAEKLPESIAGFYRLKGTETKLKGWLYESEHPAGILGKPCPVCGYKYGTGWKYTEIPADDLSRIEELIANGK